MREEKRGKKFAYRFIVCDPTFAKVAEDSVL